MTDEKVAGSNRPITNYRDFWPYYLQEHAKPATRAIHYLGTAIATGCVVAAVVTGDLWFVAAALIGGYAPAWIGHFFIETNRPATFTYPFWSLISDYRMAFLWVSGQLEDHLARAGVGPGAS